MSILILEAGDKQANTSELRDKKPAPSSRQLLQTSAILYHKGGLCLLLNGIGSACTYWVMHSLVVKLLTILLPSPAAYIVASVLLAEIHFFWTAHTILPCDQPCFVPKSHNCQQWESLDASHSGLRYSWNGDGVCMYQLYSTMASPYHQTRKSQ